MDEKGKKYFIKNKHIVLEDFVNKLSQRIDYLEKLLHSVLLNQKSNDVNNIQIKTTTLMNCDEGVDEIINIVCNYLNLDRIIVLSNKTIKHRIRDKNLVLCRKICYYFINLYYPLLSPEKIAKKFDNRHRTTVIYSLRNIKDIMSVNEKLEQNIDLINLIIKQKLIINE